MSIDSYSRRKLDQSKRLFSTRSSVMNHWQETCDLFYYERAQFLAVNSNNRGLAADQFSAVPALARREMGDLFRAMLRPPDFVEVKTQSDEINEMNNPSKWLEWATKLMRKSMYRKGANFVHSTVLTDHDWVSIGQGAIEVCPRKDRMGVYFKNHHLRDVAWTEDYEGNVQDIHIKSKPTIDVLKQVFQDSFPKDFDSMMRDDPQQTVECHRIICPIGEDYSGPKHGSHKFVELWILPGYETVLEKKTKPYKGVVIPRADRPDGTQYAYSPFTSIILPDARTKQAIERVLLEAGEKAVDPPMLAQANILQGDASLYAGGITFLDAEYDERLGEGLRPVNQNYSGLPYGIEMSNRYDEIITQGMKLNKINLPADLGNMTAFEVRKRIEEHMRAHIPMFEPVEAEYNEPLSSEIFEVIQSMNGFGPPESMPEELSGQDIVFEFKSPIKDIENEGKAQQYAEGIEVLRIAMEKNPNLALLADDEEAVRDVLQSIWPADWLVDEKDYEKALAGAMQEMESQKMLSQAAGVADIANKATPAMQAMQVAA